MLFIGGQEPEQNENRAACVVGLTNWYSIFGAHNAVMTQLNSNQK